MFKSLVKLHNHHHIVHVDPSTMTQYNIVSFQFTNYLFNNSLYIPFPNPDTFKLYPNAETDPSTRRTLVYDWTRDTLKNIKYTIQYIDIPHRFTKPTIHVFDHKTTSPALEFISSKGYSKVLWGCMEFKLEKGIVEIIASYSHEVREKAHIPIQKHFNYSVAPVNFNMKLEVGMISYDGFNFDVEYDYPENEYVSKYNLTPMNTTVSVLSTSQIKNMEIGEQDIYSMMNVLSDKDETFDFNIIQEDKHRSKLLFKQFGLSVQNMNLEVLHFKGDVYNADITFEVEPTSNEKKCVMM
jgi:hypothetical protein